MAALGFAGAAVDVAFVTPDGEIAVAGTMVEARVLLAIRTASETTGVAFPYLLAKAYRESGFDSSADASSSSASGMFQFTRQTWLDLFQRYGRVYGQGDLADVIVRAAKGGLTVPDTDEGRLILNLRHDPDLAAHLAAEYTRENRRVLTRAMGRAVMPEELYIAHFLGAQGAVQLLRAVDSRPSVRAASVFPDAAASNPGLFYPRPERVAVSVSTLHRRLVRAFRRELLRFASFSPEAFTRLPSREIPALTVPRKPDPSGSGVVSVRRTVPPEEDLRAVLARAVLPGGGFALPWVDAGLSGAEPVRVPPLRRGVREGAVLGALKGRANPSEDIRDEPSIAPQGWAEVLDMPVHATTLSQHVAAVVSATAEVVFDRVPGDSAVGLLPHVLAPRFAAAMPERATVPSAKVAGGLVPRYEDAAEAPELAEVTERVLRPGA
ncbi:MAG: hypothetical protein JXQ84_04330 [Rhodospirillaceae bacterium]|nr:hypothetical protein [Rhodospirillaceae bacterium]